MRAAGDGGATPVGCVEGLTGVLGGGVVTAVLAGSAVASCWPSRGSCSLSSVT